jgi:hypothetical protein
MERSRLWAVVYGMKSATSGQWCTVLGSGVRGQDPSREGGVLGGVELLGWALSFYGLQTGSEQGCMRVGVGRELVQGDFVVRSEGESRAHEARDKRGRQLKEAAERAGLEGLGKRGEESGGVGGAQGDNGGKGAAEDLRANEATRRAMSAGPASTAPPSDVLRISCDQSVS